MSINKYKLNIIVINLQNNINLQYIYLLSLFILEFCSRIFDIFVKFGKAAAANDPTSQNRCRWTSTLEKIEFSRQLVPYLKAAVQKYNNPLKKQRTLIFINSQPANPNFHQFTTAVKSLFSLNATAGFNPSKQCAAAKPWCKRVMVALPIFIETYELCVLIYNI